MTTYFIPFRTGDVVKIVKPVPDGWDHRGRTYDKDSVGEIHIIESFDVESKEYSTDHGAWYPHKVFELVRPCDQKSLRKLYRLINEG